MTRSDAMIKHFRELAGGVSQSEILQSSHLGTLLLK